MQDSNIKKPLNFKVVPGETKEQYRERMIALLKDENSRMRASMVNGELKVVMDVDDFGFLLPGYDDLIRLKESLPNLKITCFTIPMDKNFFNSQNSKHFKWESYKKWADIVNKMDWIEIALHGFAHVHHECDTTYEQSVTLLKAVEKTWERVGLEYVKLIKAPYWQMSYDFMIACRDMGYTVAIDRNHMRPVPKDLKTYIFNWSFEEALPLEVNPIKGHGHFVGNNKNNISDTLSNILVQLPKETQFMFVSDYLKKYGSDTEKIQKLYEKGGNPSEDSFSDTGRPDES